MHRGDEDDRRLLEARMPVDHGGGLEAVHVRHVDVEQDGGELALHQPRERLPARARLDEVEPEVAEDRVVAEQARRLVVDQQDVDPVVAARGRRHAGHRCSQMRSSDSSCSVLTGFAM